MQSWRGIYCKGIWVFVEGARGERDILTEGQYSVARLKPPVAALPSDEQYHENVLAHRRGEPI
jgi:hypothetical protein